MDEKTRRLRTGSFVVGGLVLVLLILFFLGGRDLFAHKITVVTSFSESVQGLSRGSAVKFRGAPIGTVSDISIHFASNMVQVEMEIDVSSFSDDEDELRSKFLYAVREKGLRCRLEHQGITGLKFIDFDYFGGTSRINRKGLSSKAADAIEVPSVPSTFQDVLGTITKSLDRLSKIDIDGISSDIARTVSEISDILADPAIKSAISRINEAAANIESSTQTINRVCSEERLDRLMFSLESGILKINQFIENADRETAAAKLPDSTAAFRSATAAVVESRREIGNTLLKMNQALDALRMLLEYIESDPNSIINGKKKLPGGQK